MARRRVRRPDSVFVFERTAPRTFQRQRRVKPKRANGWAWVGVVLSVLGALFWVFPRPFVKGLEAIGMIPTESAVERLYYTERYLDVLPGTALAGLVIVAFCTTRGGK